MEKIIKLQSKISSFQDVEKSLREIEKMFNDLTKSVNSKAESQITDREGKTGDLQVTMNTDKSYTFEFKTDTGWKTPIFQENIVTFKDKPRQANQPKKSIDEIETDDTSTGDSKAKKTIFDEKADKFILSRPDYESDWTNVTNATNYDFIHNLGTKIFKLVQIIFKDDSDRIFYPGVWISEQGTADTGLYAYAKTDDIMEIATGNTNIYEYDNTTLNTNFEHVSDGHIKVMLWK